MSAPKHTAGPWTTKDVVARIVEKGGVPDIGQLPDAIITDLRKLVGEGSLATYKGHWNTLSPGFGIGPLKTIYALPDYAAFQTEAW